MGDINGIEKKALYRIIEKKIIVNCNLEFRYTSKAFGKIDTNLFITHLYKISL